MTVFPKRTPVFLKNPVLLLACLALVACAANGPAGTPDFTGPVDDIAKSPNDMREYRALVLDNGLKVMLVSDPEADKAAASMDVNAGSNTDPADFEGLAHFLEHMLFLGTEKFPASGEYQEFIATHGGGHNAYTAHENTNYYFDIEKDSLAGALDRFAQFFIAPLFNPEYVDRERNAVHSEYQSNLQNDGRRSYSIFKQVINPAHPLAQFSVGSLDTLRDKEAGTLRDALLDHYQRWYSANLMSLAILGTESLDELEALARQYFSAVENRSVAPPVTTEPLFEAGTLPALLEIEPVRDARSLTYTFPIPVVKARYKAKPLNFLGNILGHEGEGSLLSLLREQGWANGLSAGGGLSYDDNATFTITVALTEAGLDQVDEISALVFRFIDIAARDGMQPWLFEEQQLMADLAFTFQEPARPIATVQGLSRLLQDYPPRELLTLAYAFDEFDPALYREILSYLRPDNLLLTFTSQRVNTDREDALFGGRYRFSPIEADRLARWREAVDDASLAITAPNPFLPEDISIRDEAGAGGVRGVTGKPALLRDGGGVRLWYKHDNEFQVPRANFYLYAMTPVFNDSLKNNLLSGFVVSLVNDKLNEYSYPANLAGVYYSVGRRARGWTIGLGGYQDKQDILLKAVLDTIVAADFEQERFDIIKAEMIRGWENADKQTPYIHLYGELQALLVNPYWSEEERIDAVRDITLDEVVAFVPRMLEDLKLQALYHGNILQADALAMMDIVERYLLVSEQAEDPPFGTVVKLEANTRVVQEIEVDHDDSAIVIYLQGPDDSLQTRALVSLLGTIMRTPFYDTLRTEQQLGYVVNAGSMPILKTNGLVMTIESPGSDPIALESHIDAFLADYTQTLANLSAGAFADIKAGLLNTMRQAPQSLGSLSGRFWSDILIEEFEEDSTLMMADAIEQLTLEQVFNYYRDHVSNPNAGRLVARSAGRPHRTLFLAALDDEPRQGITVRELPESYQAFKRGSELFHFRD